MKKISLKWQLMFICIILVTVPVVFLGILSYTEIEKSTYDQVESSISQQALMVERDIRKTYDLGISSVDDDLNILRTFFFECKDNRQYPSLDSDDIMDVVAVDQVSGASSVISIPKMKLDGIDMAYDYEKIDKIKAAVGGTATVFQLIPGGLLRISTNVLKTDGSRAVGTYIPSSSPVYQSILQGTAYHGRAYVVNQWYLTAYEPLMDRSGTIIGALYFGLPEEEYKEKILESLEKVVVGKTGYVWVIDDEGNYVLSQGRQRDGENILDAQDSDGNYFIKEIIDESQGMSSEEVGLKEYPWQNSGESKERTKIASFVRFSEWEWTIGTSVYKDDYADGLNRIKNITFIICLVFIMVGSALSYFFAESLSKALGHMKRVIGRVSEGDMTQRVEIRSSVLEFKQISDDFDMMVENIHQLLFSVKNNIDVTASQSGALSASAEEVNASVEQVSSTVQEISKSAQDLSKNSNEVAIKSKEAAESASMGKDLTSSVKDQMSQISSTTNTSAQKVKDLSTKSQKIGNIVETINNISEQTNLLALNAAIEAARAGEAGKGFAVVADEVRKLAEESQNATGLISELLGSIQDDINSSVSSMDENSKQVETGSESVTNAVDSINKIPVLITDVNKSILGITAIAEENAAGSEEVSASVEEVTSAMQEVASAAQKLAINANELKGLISKFKIEDGSAGKAKEEEILDGIKKSQEKALQS